MPFRNFVKSVKTSMEVNEIKRRVKQFQTNLRKCPSRKTILLGKGNGKNRGGRKLEERERSIGRSIDRFWRRRGGEERKGGKFTRRSKHEHVKAKPRASGRLSSSWKEGEGRRGWTGRNVAPSPI